MTKTKNSALLMLSCLCFSSQLMASHDTRAEIGYMGFSQDTLARNPGAFDQPYLLVSHHLQQPRQELFGSLKLENPGAPAKDQKHRPGREAAKLFVRYQPREQQAPGIWLQGFSMLSDAIIENNLFMGLKQGGDWQGLGVKLGAGAHYSFGCSDFTELEYAGWSGMVTTVQLQWSHPVAHLSLDWIGHYFRNRDHMATFGYHGSGQQLTLSANRLLYRNWSLQGKLTGYKSLGANPNDGVEYALGLNYRF